MTEENEDDGEFDVNNSTYTEKVLPDGTVVKVNRTVISDTSDDGSSFFYHSTSFHNFGQGSDDQDDDEVFDEFPISTSESIPVVPDVEDFENEISQTNEIPLENVGIDDGLKSGGIA